MTGLCCFSFVSPGRVVFDKNVPNFRTLAIWCYREVFPAKNVLINLHYLDWKCSLLGGPSSGSNNFVVKALFCHMQPGSARYHGHLSSWHFLNPTAPRASAQSTQLSTRDFCFPPWKHICPSVFQRCRFEFFTGFHFWDSVGSTLPMFYRGFPRYFIQSSIWRPPSTPNEAP